MISNSTYDSGTERNYRMPLTDVEVHKPRIERPVRPQRASERRRSLPGVVGVLLAIACVIDGGYGGHSGQSEWTATKLFDIYRAGPDLMTHEERPSQRRRESQALNKQEPAAR